MVNLKHCKNSKKDNLYIDSMFAKCEVGIVCKDADLRYTDINKFYCDLFSIKDSSKIIGTKTNEYMTQKEMNIINSTDMEVKESKSSMDYVIGYSKGKYLNILTSPIIHENNFAGIISFVKDITNEEAIKEQFVNKHFQLEALLKNIPMIIYMQNKNLEYITGTKQAKSFLNEGLDAIEGIYITHFDDREFSLSAIKKKKCLTREIELIDNKGFPHRYKIQKIPIKDFNDKVIGLITIAANLDSEKALQVQRETFVASIGHDLKNPTIAQIRSIELLLNGSFGKINNEQRELLSLILDSCRYMNGMLSSLLDTYRTYKGVIKLNFSEFSLLELVQDCVSEMVYVAKDKDIAIKIDTKENKNSDLYIVVADRVQIRRVIMNLISNGIKYAFGNSDLILKIYIEKSDMCFQFENNSPYINDERKKKIFAQYVSYAEKSKVHGTGLGLYASKKIIEGHRGEIFVKSFKNNKNIFGFKIPISAKSDCNREIIF
ncbi:MAG: HAMP domain-containing histidine kinase [bacterium]|nr:HAMP domain-containing histidine kinase [bacterium]